MYALCRDFISRSYKPQVAEATRQAALNEQKRLRAVDEEDAERRCPGLGLGSTGRGMVQNWNSAIAGISLIAFW